MKARAEKTCWANCLVLLCALMHCADSTELVWSHELFQPFFASNIFDADCNHSVHFHDMSYLCRHMTAGDFVNFGQKCVLADLDVATWN